MRAVLFAHPATPCSHIESLEATVTCEAARVLSIRYIVRGAIDKIRWPAAEAAVRTNNLWEHTCFEVFVRAPHERAYVELNFAPSTRWAAYRFSDYRVDMSDLDVPESPHVSSRSDSRHMEMQVGIQLEILSSKRAPWHVALSAVIEDQSGYKSYWALAHPSARPDFHHADAFTLELRCI